MSLPENLPAVANAEVLRAERAPGAGEPQRGGAERPTLDAGETSRPPLTNTNAFLAQRDAVLERYAERLGSRRVALVSYATANLVENHRKFLQNAVALGGFTDLAVWTSARLAGHEFARTHAGILRERRGAGYWLWKPYIIQQQMELMSDGDFIVYHDVGRGQPYPLSESVLPLLDWCDRVSPLLFHPPLPAYPNRVWTKRDCFVYMDCDEARYWEHPQIAATYLVLKVTPLARRFIAEWLRYCTDRRIVTDDRDVCGLPTLPGFVDNRHDQSVLTNLALKFELPLFRPFGDAAYNIGAKDINVLSRELLFHRIIGDRRNLARGRACSQSSRCGYSYGASVEEDARGAVKGYRRHSCSFHTEREDRPWWSLDLGAIHEVEEIHVHNRSGSTAERARALLVEGSVDGETWTPLFHNTSGAWDPQLPLICRLKGHPLRHLRLSLTQGGYLHLDEVEIYGSAFTQ